MANDWLKPLVHSWENDYTPELGLYRRLHSYKGYHTSIKQEQYVHPLWPNSTYALALLDSGLSQLQGRAFSILEKVVSLQDRNPEHATCGIWSYFFEEPLEEMEAPDWNWADFIGKNLVLTLIRHEHRLPEPLRQEIRTSLAFAIEAIMKRNVGPSYTNIAIMGAFVSLVGGEVLGRSDYADYGLQRLERFYEFTKELGTFQEYNSPAYATITILELSKLRKETKRERAVEMAQELLDLAWIMVAGHYHAPSGEWAGPHSRSYHTLLQANTRSFLQYATHGAATHMPWGKLEYSPEWVDSGLACPAELYGYFRESGTKTIRDLVHIHPVSGVRKVATSYLTDSYALGTFNTESLWNQCRPVLAYAGNRGHPVYLQVRFLNNGYDFCSAMVTCSQQEGSALFGIHMVTNGGNTHPSLSPTQGFITTKDLRLRFELGGELSGIQLLNRTERGLDVKFGGEDLALRLLHGEFVEAGSEGAACVAWDIHETNGTWCADLVLYNGAERKFALREIKKLALVFALSFQDHSPDSYIRVHQENGLINAAGHIAGHALAVTLPDHPVEQP